MTTTTQWGKHLRHLRNQAGLTQGELIEQLSHAVTTLSDEEVTALQQTGLYEETTTYLGGILDNSALSKLETGKRGIGSRKRSMAFVWGFKKLAVLEETAAANHFLELGDFRHLTPDEVSAFFDNDVKDAPPLIPPKGEETPIPLPTEGQPKTVISAEPPPTIAKPSTEPRKLPILPLLLGFLALSAIGWIALQRVGNRDNSQLSQMTIVDNFSGEELDPEIWDTTNAPHAQIENGQLLFDVPPNESEDWLGEYLEHYGGAGELSQLKYTFSIDTPQVYNPGVMGITTGCQDDNGWLSIFAGGDPATLFVEFAPTDEIVDWDRDVNVINIMPIEHGESYDVDLNWTGEVVQLSINGETQTDALIKCNTTSYFSIGTSSNPSEKVRGFIDDLQVWY